MSIDLFGKAHASADTDAERDAIHHTLGSGPNQAAQGNHNHADDLLAYYLKTDADAKFLTGQNLLTTVTAAMLPGDPALPVGTSMFSSSSAGAGWPNTSGTGLIIKTNVGGSRALQIFMDLNSNVSFRTAVSSGAAWGAWQQVSDSDSGWITTGLLQCAAAPAEAPFLGGVINTQRLRVINNLIELRVVMTANTGTLTGNASGNYTNLNVVTGLPSQYRPVGATVNLSARLNDIAVGAVMDGTGTIILTGGPPNVAYPASAVFQATGTWLMG
jgi:hypothetical protein